MFYEQLLHTQIPKVHKRLTNWLYFLALLGSGRAKAACRMLMKLTPDLILNPSKDQLKM
jgi:hypothetical protein